MQQATGDRRLWILLGALAGLVLVNAPELGSDPWPFRTGRVHPRGLVGPVVGAAGRRWDLGLMRSIVVLAGVLVLLAVLAAIAGRLRGRGVHVALAVVVVSAILFPAVVLQAGLRQATAPWFYTNDSTYQIELGGALVRHGHDPYGHDYSHGGLQRFYSLDGSVGTQTRTRQVALKHFAYFPGTALLAAAWGVLPHPLDDYRFLVALCGFLLLGVALLFRGPLSLRLALGAVLAANPLVVRAAWFGTADTPSLFLVMLGFALLTRARFVGAAAALAGAVLAKQFALVAVPFAAAALLTRAPRARVLRASAVFVAILTVGFLPFLVADPGALWSDTVSYGARTYRIVGYGLAALLIRAHVLNSRTGSYPFALLAVVVWLPVTAWLVLRQLRSNALWTAATGFGASIFLLLFLGRVFQTSYLVWPLTALVLAALLANADDERRRARAEIAGEVERGELQPVPPGA